MRSGEPLSFVAVIINVRFGFVFLTMFLKTETSPASAPRPPYPSLETSTVPGTEKAPGYCQNASNVWLHFPREKTGAQKA